MSSLVATTTIAAIAVTANSSSSRRMFATHAAGAARRARIQFLGPREPLWAAQQHKTTSSNEPHPLAKLYGPTVEPPPSTSVSVSPSTTAAKATTPSTTSSGVQAMTLGVYSSREAMPPAYRYPTLSPEEIHAIEVFHVPRIVMASVLFI